MDSDITLPPTCVLKCCDCDCDCSVVASSSSGLWNRTVKRKYEEFKEGNRFFLPGFDPYSNAKILAEDECIVLREALSCQRKAAEDLYVELEEERKAASSAVNETMLMILRLQREKAEIQMEARQFKTYAEEKMSHDQEELVGLEELLYEKEQAIEALSYEVEACKHRMLSYGFTEAEIQGERFGFSRNPSVIGVDAQYDVYAHDYTPVKCNVNGTPRASEGNADFGGVEKCQFPESPSGQEHFKCLERRISQLEHDREDVIEKMIVGQSPRWRGHARRLSMDSFGLNSPLGTARELKETFFTDSPRSTSSFKKMESVHIDSALEVQDDMSDRVYTIDSVHVGVSEIGIDEAKTTGTKSFANFSNSPRYQESFVNHRGVNEPDIEKLFTRLQALEADKESLRQVILSMRTDKAQLVLLKEIAQHLSKEMSSDKRMPMRKTPFLGTFSVVTVFKWITSVLSWKRRATQKKYVYRVSANNMGLLMFIDKGCRTRAWKCFTSTQV
ncbi:PREDICTED: myosin-binding protein 7 [Tarenaya hassleriana]|uniref:myosin-binding protein 7 n=1 Tax=Tarenaya hassleriana TaxID=28532 RepID=UPI00053C6A20|nr:PREDICTED: myosin-binding protein 7 [Tarenaya hassleriana]